MFMQCKVNAFTAEATKTSRAELRAGPADTADRAKRRSFRAMRLSLVTGAIMSSAMRRLERRIIQPVLTERAEAYGLTLPDWKKRLARLARPAKRRPRA